MKSEDMDLDGLLARKPDEGLLELRGHRALIADASAAYRLAEELEETLGRDGARGVLTRFGYQTGYQEAARLRNYYDWESDVEWLLAGARAQALFGIGRLRFSELVLDRTRGIFRAVATAERAFEATERKRRHGPSAEPVCDRLTGYLSGFASAFASDDVLFIETECAARSEDATACRFEGRLASEWGPEGHKHGALYKHDAIGERLATRDREVVAQAIKIQEQELVLAAKQRIEEASRLKSEFLANISHELRTPLNAIMGYGDLLLAKLGPKLPATPRQNLERIVSNATHLLGLINGVLDISKLEAGRMELCLEAVDARELLDRCAEDAAILLGEKPVELVRAYAQESLPKVLADKIKLQQCVTNLLANAVKFTEQGSIRIEARRIAGQRSGRTQGFLAIAVVDTGPGISEDHHALIFEPFRQVDASVTRRHGGTGLGLPIVRRLLGLMGGEIQVQSTPGAGATFTAVVPVADENAIAPASALPLERPPSGTGSLGLLVIDDDPDFAAIVRGAFADAPLPLRRLRLRIERDPIAAVAAARVTRPAAVLLDLRLPGLDGREVLRLLGSDERTRGVPVIVVSARDDLRETLAQGAVAALQKPVSKEVLLDAVAAALGPREGPS